MFEPVTHGGVLEDEPTRVLVPFVVAELAEGHQILGNVVATCTSTRNVMGLVRPGLRAADAVKRSHDFEEDWIFDAVGLHLDLTKQDWCRTQAAIGEWMMKRIEKLAYQALERLRADPTYKGQPAIDLYEAGYRKAREEICERIKEIAVGYPVTYGGPNVGDNARKHAEWMYSYLLQLSEKLSTWGEVDDEAD
jgi:hypothetical protein